MTIKANTPNEYRAGTAMPTGTLTVTTDLAAVVESLRDLGFTVVSPDESAAVGSVQLARQEAETYTIDALEREIREVIEYDLNDVPPEEGGPTPAQVEWAKETAERIARSWAMHRDGYVEYALELSKEERTP